ncbi:MAG TPA: zf-HC2 domain-containing protein [Candidatus Limnocylindria bacterium]|nr:zf-HC2 domain-containing protein [Candidatus Limnocylindria bacterium]
MIACREAVERLWGYLDRNLERRQEEELEQHLGLCRHCCGELEFSKQVRAKLASSGETGLSSTGRERLEEFVRRLGE